MSRGPRLPASLFAIVLVLMTACRAPQGSQTLDDQASVAVNAVSASLLPERVAELPEFGFEDFEDLMAQLRGTPVVVNIWSSWCGPCRRETEDLADAASRYGKDVQFLGIDILDERQDAVAFLMEHGVNYASVFDPPGEIRDRLGFIGQPNTVFYDSEGKVVSVWTGPLTEESLRVNLEKIAPRGLIGG